MSMRYKVVNACTTYYYTLIGLRSDNGLKN